MKSDWKHVTLAAISTQLSDGLHKAPIFVPGGEYIFVNATNLENGTIVDKDQQKHTTYEEFLKYGVALDDRTILYSIDGTIGNIARYRGEKCVLGKGACYISVSGDVDVDYIYYQLQSPHFNSYIESMSTGSTIRHISLKTMRNYTFPLPDACIQKKVGRTLALIDEKIAVNKKINNNLLEQIQALYKAWFVDYLPFGGVKPESWTQTDIYSLANIIYGAPFASKQFNTEGNGKPIIRIRDLKDQQFATYTTEVHPKGYLLQPGDIVVGMDGEFRPYIWGNDEAWLNQRVCVFENKRPNGKAFLYFTIKPLLFAIEQTQVATTVIHIGKKDYDAFEITLPDSSTLDSFDALTSPMITQIVSNSFENKRLAAMRDTLLPKLMSGELDVSDIQI